MGAGQIGGILTGSSVHLGVVTHYDIGTRFPRGTIMPGDGVVRSSSRRRGEESDKIVASSFSHDTKARRLPTDAIDEELEAFVGAIDP